MDLELSEHIQDGHVVVTLHGELDVSTAQELRERLFAILEREPASLILDLSRLRFMDSTGVNVLVSAEQRADLRGWTLSLAGLQKIVARVIHITSLDRYFRIFPTVEDALLADPKTGPAPDPKPGEAAGREAGDGCDPGQAASREADPDADPEAKANGHVPAT